MFLMRSPPNTRNRLSSSERKKRVDPGSPCRPERPRSWLSMRRDSWRSVPTTCSPPSARTSSRSTLVTTENSAAIASNAARNPRSTGSSVGAFSHANTSLSSASSSGTDFLPQPSTAASTAATAAAVVSSLSSHGNTEGSVFHDFVEGTAAPSFFSKAISSSSLITTSGMNISRSFKRAMNSALPPRIMSVPRPAMLVEMVTAPLRPLWDTISDSRSTFSGLAFRSWKGMPSLVSRPARNSLRSTLVVPTSTGRPSLCMRLISAHTEFHLASSVLNTTSAESKRLFSRFMGTTATERL
mmetsp:Transcript_12688/g.24063  ORF Transcript_12688/g.24063 Transcript_12688/m.24063 type:complete len:298 (-) Transcript_12688:1412-2305(-)